MANLGEMAAGIAHELNNPLAVISSNTTLVEKLTEKQRLSLVVQVIINLISNAIDAIYHQEAPWINIRTQQKKLVKVQV